MWVYILVVPQNAKDNQYYWGRYGVSTMEIAVSHLG